jgi:hypothetical protein
MIGFKSIFREGIGGKKVVSVFSGVIGFGTAQFAHCDLLGRDYNSGLIFL